MAHSKQAQKRIRQTERNRIVNKAKMTRLKSAMKKIMAAIEAGNKGEAQKLLNSVFATIDKAAKTDVIHKNTASRKKSQITRAVTAMK